MRGWSKMSKEEVVAACGGTQFGVGIPWACVNMRHNLLLEWTLDPTKALLGIDLSNMHNIVSIARLETQVAHRAPRMAELLGWLRSRRTHIYKDERGQMHKVEPQDGLDQGGPASNSLAPLSVAEAHEDLGAFASVFGMQDHTYVFTRGSNGGTVRLLRPSVFFGGFCREVFQLLRRLPWFVQLGGQQHRCD